MDERIYYWDNLKFFLMLLVVIAHFFGGLTLGLAKFVYAFIFLFHMPLFIFVSGVFHKNENISERVVSLILVGIVYNIFLYIINVIILGNSSEFYIFKATNIPWFVFALAVCNVITYCFRNCDNRICFIVAILIGCFVGYDSIIISDVTLAKTLTWYPFYYCGWLFGSKLPLNSNNRKWRMGGGFALVLLL